MKLVKPLTLAASVLLWAATGQANAANLIVNGNFASPNVGGGFNIFPNGFVPGWTSNNNETEIDFTPILSLPCYDADCQSMEADGNTFDTISQTVTGLTVGQTYLLSWGYGDRPGSGPQQVDVSFGGGLVGIDFGSGSGTWTSNLAVVTATATSEILSFAAVDTSGSGGASSVGNEIDGVSLCAVGVPCSSVPEPASMLLLGSGVLGFGLLRRRR